MHICKVKLKNGKKVSGIVWIWRPREGWFDLAGVDDDNAPEQQRQDNETCYLDQPFPGGMMRVLLRDVETAIEEGERVGILKDENRNIIGPKIEDVDLLKRAKDTGWNGE